MLLGSADLTDCGALFLDGRCSPGKCMCVCACNCALAERVCSWVHFIKRVEARVASQGQPGSQALHLAVCQETLRS